MENSDVRIAVVGAGAVGCYFGGMLSRAGHSVILIGRARHVQAIQRDGLLMETATFREYVRIEASTEPSNVRDASLILYCVKSDDTESAAEGIAPHLRADAQILSLQNGIDNAERLQGELRHAVHPAVVYVATEMAGDGYVKHHGRGELVVGPTALRTPLREAFCSAGVQVQISENVTGELWAKLILNCAFNALSAITKMPYGPLFEAPAAREFMRAVVRECHAVAMREAVRLPRDSWQGVEGIAATMAKQFSSTAQDVMRGHRSEIEHLNGYIVRRGAALGIETPLNFALYSLVKTLETARRMEGGELTTGTV